jgi:hypothetical protein
MLKYFVTKAWYVFALTVLSSLLYSILNIPRAHVNKMSALGDRAIASYRLTCYTVGKYSSRGTHDTSVCLWLYSS